MVAKPDALLDFVSQNRSELIDRILAYAGSELLCHRAEAPPELVEVQQKTWQPLLDWCAARFKAPLKTGTGIMPIKQPPASLQCLRRVVEGYDDARFAALMRAVQASGSLVLGLALAEKHITPLQAFEAAELDASWQMEKWGADAETEARRAGIKSELDLCARAFTSS